MSKLLASRFRFPFLCVALVMLVAAAPASPQPPYLFGIPGLTITAASTSTGVMMFGGWLLNEYRQTRKLSAADRLARREGYAKQVESLQIENRRLRSDLADQESRHDDYRKACQAETDQLRSEIRGLEDQLTGFRRRLDAQASTLGRAVLGIDAPTAASRLADDHIGDKA